MAPVRSSALVAVAVAAAMATVVDAHSYLCEPTTRSDQCSPTRGDLVGPCDAPLSGAVTPAIEVTRGETLE